MNLDINDIIARYNAETAKLTQRAILAEARADAAERELEKLRSTSTNSEETA